MYFPNSENRTTVKTVVLLWHLQNSTKNIKKLSNLDGYH